MATRAPRKPIASTEAPTVVATGNTIKDGVLLTKFAIPVGSCRPVAPVLNEDECTLKMRRTPSDKWTTHVFHKTDLSGNLHNASVYEVFKAYRDAGWDVLPYHWGQ
jgi:hypothetical protein